MLVEEYPKDGIEVEAVARHGLVVVLEIFEGEVEMFDDA